MSFQRAAVDSGASSSIVGMDTARALRGSVRSSRRFKGFVQGVQQVAAREGKVTMMVMSVKGHAPAVPADAGTRKAPVLTNSVSAEKGTVLGEHESSVARGSDSCTVGAEFVDLDVTAIDGANENLMSVFQFVEKLGFSFVVTPVADQTFTGFYKRDGAGRYTCIPVVCDPQRGLYWLYYAIGRSRSDIERQVGRLESGGTDIKRMIRNGTLMLVHDDPPLVAVSDTLLCRSSSSGGELHLLDVSDGSERVVTVGMSEGDGGEDLPDPIPEANDEQVVAPRPEASGEQAAGPTGGTEVPIEDTGWFKQNDSVMSRNHRDIECGLLWRYYVCY